jgi:dTDP-glucose 4,6-dehydratase/UDP-glucose 4-epimerase
MAKTYLVTGGTGFIGSGLVRALLSAGHRVRTLDNDSRGSQAKLAAALGPRLAEVDRRTGDIRDAAAVSEAVRGVDGVCHLAYVNGTEYFYSKPELILDVAVKGMVNVIDACLAAGVGDLVLASSSEVYQTPPTVPTDETVPMVVPDPLNPRFSYGGGKIISELMAINWGRKHFRRVTIFRPHNVYGADMGWEHVVPQFAARMKVLIAERPAGIIPFPIQGSGTETRSFIHIDDAAAGILTVVEKGEHLGIYNVGTGDEVSVADLARAVAAWFGREIEVIPGKLQPGSTPRRCPSVAKLSALGFRPRVSLKEGLTRTLEWYAANPAPPREKPGS